MKNILFFMLFSLPLTAQITLLQRDSTYRLRVDTYQETDGGVDTLTQGFLPERYVTKPEFSNLLIQQIAIQNERVYELRRLVAESNGLIRDFIQYYDDVNGPGAHVAYSKEQAAQVLTGDWKLVERGVDVWTVSIDSVGAITGEKTGTIAMNDEYDIVATGLFNFDLEFTQLQNGTFRAVRQTASGQRVFILRK